jgi:hypothetical protein
MAFMGIMLRHPPPAMTRAAIAVVSLILLRADAYAFDQSGDRRDDEIREIVVTPSFWFVAMHGDIASGDLNANVKAGAADAARLTNAGGSVMLELRSHKWSVLVDVSLVHLSHQQSDVETTTTQIVVGPAVEYAFVPDSRLSVSALGGVRLLRLGSTIEEHQPPLPDRKVPQSDTWASLFAGLRLKMAVRPAIELAGRADIGGDSSDQFGSGALWQLGAGLAWRLRATHGVVLGYRYLHVRRQYLSLYYNVGEHGLFAGYEFRFLRTGHPAVRASASRRP